MSDKGTAAEEATAAMVDQIRRRYEQDWLMIAGTVRKRRPEVLHRAAILALWRRWRKARDRQRGRLPAPGPTPPASSMTLATSSSADSPRSSASWTADTTPPPTQRCLPQLAVWQPTRQVFERRRIRIELQRTRASTRCPRGRPAVFSGGPCPLALGLHMPACSSPRLRAPRLDARPATTRRYCR